MTDQFILTPSFIGEPSAPLGTLARDGWRINAPALNGGDENARMGAIHAGLRDAVADAIGAHRRPVCLSGDCCAAIGVAAGLQKAGISPALLWLDAHGDFNTKETTISGFVGGMPLAMLLGKGDQSLVAGAGAARLEEREVILADARDLDPAERRLLQHTAVRHVPRLRDVPDALLAERPLWVHFDTDIIDPSDAPAMRYQAPGGPRLAEMLEVARLIPVVAEVVALSVTVWDMPRDTDGATGRACLGVVDALLTPRRHA